jgi:hypothetical protein
MNDLSTSALLDDLDGLNASRALILHAYYGLRRAVRPTEIGTRQIAAWIHGHEPGEALPSDSLILLTLRQAKVPHRGPGRPSSDSRQHGVEPAPLLIADQPPLQR